jgi:hypothetical protein
LSAEVAGITSKERRWGGPLTDLRIQQLALNFYQVLKSGLPFSRVDSEALLMRIT